MSVQRAQNPQATTFHPDYPRKLTQRYVNIWRGGNLSAHLPQRLNLNLSHRDIYNLRKTIQESKHCVQYVVARLGYLCVCCVALVHTMLNVLYSCYTDCSVLLVVSVAFWTNSLQLCEVCYICFCKRRNDAWCLSTRCRFLYVVVFMATCFTLSHAFGWLVIICCPCWSMICMF